MKHIFSTILFAFIFSNSINLFAGTGDTTVVQTLRFDTTMRAGVFMFPNDTSKTYEKVIMLYSMRCKNGLISTSADRNKGCGEWDYNCYTYVVDSTQTDSLKSVQSSAVISNSSDTSFEYTTQPVYTYIQYTQTELSFLNILSGDSATIGSGAMNLNNPLNTGLDMSRSQYLWKASELTSAGLTAGNISSLRLDVSLLGSQITNLRIKMKQTTQTALDENNPETTGFSEVYFLNTTISSTGLHSFNFHTPFNWNGSSNLLIDFSFTSAGPGTNNSVKGDSTAFISGLVNPQHDSYLNFNGEISYVNINPSIFPLISDKISVAFWAFGDSIRLPANTSIIEGNDNYNQRQINIHLPWSDSNVYWDCGNDGTGYDRISMPALPPDIKGQWNFWVFTKNATTGTMEVYLNGLLMTNGIGKNKLINIHEMVAGMGMEVGHPYYGGFDELSIWNTDLGAADIQDIMFKDIDPTNPHYANLVAYYKLNEGTGNMANDASSFNYDSPITNETWRKNNANTIFRNFANTNLRPQVKFIIVNGTVTTAQNFQVLDSVLNNNTSVISYQVLNNDLSIIDTIYVYPAGYTYVYNSSGVKIDSIPVAATDTIHVSLLNYYQKRPMRMELINFITPYGINLDLDGLNGKTWQFDVTDYTPVLKGPLYLAMEDGNHQEDNDIKFVFIEGTPPRDVKSISQLWPSGTWVAPSYNEIYTNKYFEPRNYVLAPNASMFKVRSAISGHGQEGEFIQRSHTIRLNNSINYTRGVWKECADNAIYPQGGTWIYDRAGWCPGAVVDTKEYEITSNVSPGDTILLDYLLPPLANPGASNYRVNNQLVSYGAPNFSLDAAVDYIKTPSKRTEYLRLNPICNSPVIMIKNTGSTTLTSLDITYGRVNGAMSVHHWAGTLNFLDTTLVTLPAPSWMTSNVDAFIAIVSNPNNGSDQYSHNDTMYSEFSIPSVYPSNIIFDLKTNALGGQTSYTLKDSQGNNIISRSGLASNTFYKDTVHLNNECYTVKLNDSGDDGLSWWANPGQGTGYFRILDRFSGVVLKTFNPDFGDNIYEQFTVDFSLPVIENNSKPIESLVVYPNPASDILTAEFSLPLRTKAKLNLVNLLGEKLKAETFVVTNALESVNMDISSIANGIYFVVLESGEFSKIQKVVIAH